jgi:hypothetical protein
MSDKGTVFQKGGGGTNFEQYVQASFLATMLVRGNAPCIPTNEINEIVLQATNRKWETDDLLIIAKSFAGIHQLSAQVKHNITFSEDNEIFKEVLGAFWKDFNNPLFNKINDRLLIIKNRLNNIEKGEIKIILNYAKTHASATDFITEINRLKNRSERLEIFRTVLEKANNGVALTDIQLWEFLKCLDLLGYDFLHEGSVDETYMLNLIKLSRNPATTKTERDIWNSLITFVTRNNPSGGSFTINSLQTEEFYSTLDLHRLEPAYKAVEKLKTDSNTILQPIKNALGNSTSFFHLTRTTIIEDIIDSINESKITIVTGKAGAGKSAAVKDALSLGFAQRTIFVFRADQFNQPHLAHVFSALGIHDSLQDIFSCMALIPEKILFIDSLEKLLEGADPDNAFKQLLNLAADKDIKIIGTSRTYAVDLLTQKFGIDANHLKIADVPLLTDDELKKATDHFPVLTGSLQNEKIKSLLRSPKYLDFTIKSLALSSLDYSSYSVSQFKDKLWDTLVCNSSARLNGLPAKREAAFMEIAVQRAKAMKLFIKPHQSDDGALDLLEADDIIFQDNTKRKYAPSHDILEDWALVRYVAACYDDDADVLNFFKNLGNEPAIRRAFRLWVEDFIIAVPDKINALIKSTIGNKQIEAYWVDELLVAVFKSENSTSFFSTFENDLVADNAAFFNRCLHLIKTACRETNYEVHEAPLLLPVGSGWQDALSFTRNHLQQLDGLRLSILSFMNLWEYRLIFHYRHDKPEYADVREIVLYYINQIETGDEFWDQRTNEQYQKLLISILFFIAPLVKDEITSLIANAVKEEDERSNWRFHSFYENVLERFLGGIGTQRLALALPDLILSTAWKHWKYVSPEPREVEGLSFTEILGEYMDRDHCWGIADNFSFFPSGIYKTPLYNILRFHPRIGIDFIIRFINYSVDFYVNAKCHYKHDVSVVNITLNDGTVITQYGGHELWVAFRGHSVTDYLLESLLMTLEKYLLELAALKTDTSRQNLKFLFNYLLRNSNSVMVTAVLTSVAMAYPTAVEEEMLPLVTIKEMYRWESARPLKEGSSLAPYDDQIPFAQKERWESNQLPHRTKWRRGFADFLINYQLTIGTVNPQLTVILDKLWAESSEGDIVWRKKLHEIDTRKWEASEFQENPGQFVIQPKYEESVANFMETGKEKMESAEKAAGYSLKLGKVIEGKETLEWSQWEEQYQYFSSLETLDILHDRPVSCSVVGLRDFKEQLSNKQLKWCIDTLTNTIGYIIGETKSRNFSMTNYNILEKEIALESFHLLFDVVGHEEDRKELTFLMALALMAPFAEHEMERFTLYIRTTFAQHYPAITHKLWWVLMQYSQFSKNNPYYYDDPDTTRLQEARQKEFSFVKDLCKNQEARPVDFSSFTFANARVPILSIALFIMPYTDMQEEYRQYIFRFIELLSADLKKDDENDFSSRKKRRQLHHHLLSECEECFGELLLQTDLDFSKGIVTALTKKAYAIKKTELYTSGNIIEFIYHILNHIIDKLDKYLSPETDDIKKEEIIRKFWELWKHIYNAVLKSKKEYFTSILLFDKQYSWFDERQDFSVFRGKTDFYKEMLFAIGSKTIISAIKVLSTVGTKEFLPEGLTWIARLLKNHPDQIESLNTGSGERLIKRLYYDHMPAIKKSQTLINDFIWILDSMVQLGNSTAYLFRENVISYKKDN